MYKYKYVLKNHDNGHFDIPTINELLNNMSLLFKFNNNKRCIIVSQNGNTYWGSDGKEDWTYYCYCSSESDGFNVNNVNLCAGNYYTDEYLIDKIAPYVNTIEMDDSLTCHEQQQKMDNDQRFEKVIKNYNWMKIVNELNKRGVIKYIERDTDYYMDNSDIRITSIQGKPQRPGLSLSCFGNVNNLTNEGQLMLKLLEIKN